MCFQTHENPTSATEALEDCNQPESAKTLMGPHDQWGRGPFAALLDQQQVVSSSLVAVERERERDYGLFLT